MTKILTGATAPQLHRAAAPAARSAVPGGRQGRRIGYGRVSTAHQTEAQQQAQLEVAGCDAIHTETISSGRKDRPVLAQVLAELQAGDTLVICKLDRLARSLQELLAIAADLEARGINLQVLDQAIDTSTPTGRLLFQLLGAVGEFERALAIERTRASVEHRKATGGNLGGRPRSYTDQQQELARRLQSEGQSAQAIAAALGMPRSTVRRMLAEAHPMAETPGADRSQRKQEVQS